MRQSTQSSPEPCTHHLPKGIPNKGRPGGEDNEHLRAIPPMTSRQQGHPHDRRRCPDGVRGIEVVLHSFEVELPEGEDDEKEDAEDEQDDDVWQ